MRFLDPVEDFQTIKRAILQPNIEDQQPRHSAVYLGQCLVRIACFAGVVAFVFQYAGDQSTDVRLVIDDQDIIRHACSPFSG